MDFWSPCTTIPLWVKNSIRVSVGAVTMEVQWKTRVGPGPCGWMIFPSSDAPWDSWCRCWDGVTPWRYVLAPTVMFSVWNYPGWRKKKYRRVAPEAKMDPRVSVLLYRSHFKLMSHNEFETWNPISLLSSLGWLWLLVWKHVTRGGSLFLEKNILAMNGSLNKGLFPKPALRWFETRHYAGLK